jgi:hypothetical protein
VNTCCHSPSVTSSLTRGWVCRLQLLLTLASAVILESESTVLNSEPLNLEGQRPGPRIYIPQWQGGPVIPRDTRFRFRRLLRLAGPRLRYSNPPPHGHSLCRVYSANIYKISL